MISLEFVVFLNCVSVGIMTGLMSDLSYFIKKIFKQNLIINIVLDFCVYFIGMVFIFLTITKMHDGIFRIYDIVGFVFGVIIEKMSLSKLIAKFFDILYNKFTKVKRDLIRNEKFRELFK